ncbi:hypothetical protein LSAT2_017469 [Lamellibrachia satsuma]|nr:hypothetical protein LSAT2_017469 [Lamellibrachia satsuma]
MGVETWDMGGGDGRLAPQTASVRQIAHSSTPRDMNSSLKQVLAVAMVMACISPVARCVFFRNSGCSEENNDEGMWMCCQDVMWMRGTLYDECCGDQLFDTRKSVCCDGRIVPSTDGKKYHRFPDGNPLDPPMAEMAQSSAYGLLEVDDCCLHNFHLAIETTRVEEPKVEVKMIGATLTRWQYKH